MCMYMDTHIFIHAYNDTHINVNNLHTYCMYIHTPMSHAYDYVVFLGCVSYMATSFSNIWLISISFGIFGCFKMTSKRPI